MWAILCTFFAQSSHKPKTLKNSLLIKKKSECGGRFLLFCDIDNHRMCS